MPNGKSLPPPAMSTGWIREELNKKANREWTEVKFDTLNTAVATAREIALSAKKRTERAHECIHEGTLTNINIAVASWGKWWRGVMITVIAAIIILGSTLASWWYTQLALEEDVETVTESVKGLDVAVTEIKVSQQELKVAFETSEQRQVSGAKEQLKAIKGVFKEALKEVSSSRAHRPSRRER